MKREPAFRKVALGAARVAVAADARAGLVEMLYAEPRAPRVLEAKA